MVGYELIANQRVGLLMKASSSQLQETHMPVEIIGELGTPGEDPEWVSAQATLAAALDVLS